MPVLWEWRDTVLLITTVGAYSNQEMANAFAEMRGDKGFVRGTPLVFDARESKAELTKGDVDWRVGSFADAMKRDGFGPRMAFVLSTKEPHRYGIARMVQALSQLKGFETVIFRDLDEALRWARESSTGSAT